jgi:hypothetical protein
MMDFRPQTYNTLDKCTSCGCIGFVVHSRSPVCSTSCPHVFTTITVWAVTSIISQYISSMDEEEGRKGDKTNFLKKGRKRY